jgi:excisionase family DNA binding protein
MDKNERSAGVRPRSEKTRIPASAGNKITRKATLPSSNPELKSWTPKLEVVSRLGISIKTLDRMITSGKIEQAYIAIPGRRPMPVLNPSDVAKLEATTVQPKPFVMAAAPEGGSAGTELAVRSSAAAVPALVELLQAVARPAPQPLFLTMDESAQYSGLPVATLKQFVANGKLPALKTGRGWRIRKQDLEEQSASFTSSN